jgi:hypothetical protein
VWNAPDGGTCWKNLAVYSPIRNEWVYTNESSTLVLRDSVVDPRAVDPRAIETGLAPPLGLRPDFLAVLEYDKSRCKEIGEAILRYAAAMKPIPEEWLTELAELTERNSTETNESIH